jgi:hypothetical protein
MTATDFADAIGIGKASVTSFARGKTSYLSHVYPKAWEWFKRREIAGFLMPRAFNKPAKLGLGAGTQPDFFLMMVVPAGRELVPNGVRNPRLLPVDDEEDTNT